METVQLSAQNFIEHLLQGKEWNLHYKEPHREGTIEIWLRDGHDQFVLNWVEYPPGELDSRHLYTRDERHVFNFSADLLAFLSREKLSLDQFRSQR